MLGMSKRTLIIVAVLGGFVLIYALGQGRQSAEPGSGGAGGAGGTSGSSGCQVRVTADVLNVRAAPGTGSTIVGKYVRDAETDAERVVKDGFRKLAENRWAADEYLQPLDGATCQ